MTKPRLKFRRALTIPKESITTKGWVNYCFRYCIITRYEVEHGSFALNWATYQYERELDTTLPRLSQVELISLRFECFRLYQIVFRELLSGKGSFSMSKAPPGWSSKLY